MISLALLAFTAFAPPDADDDLALAVGLARRGWIDLAEELCEKVRKDPGAGAKARANVPLVMAEVAVEKARREPTGADAAKVLDASLKILRAEPRPSLEMRTTIGWVLGEKARLLCTAAELEEDPGARGSAAADAVRASAEFEDFERALIDELKKMPSTPDVEGALLDARFDLPKALLARARLPGSPDGTRRALLKQALDGFLDVEFDTTPPFCWEAELEEGRCHSELGNFAKAEARFQKIIDLKKLLGARAPEALIQRSTLHLSQSLLSAGKPKDAAALVDNFLKLNPALANSGIGFALQLEKGSALHAQGNVAAAVALGLKVEKVDPDGSLGKMARQRIRSWVGDGRGSPSLWMTLAEAEMAQGRHREAAKSLRRCIEACSTPAEKSTIEPAALFKLAECHRALHQEPEAAATFEQVFRRWPAHELAASAGVEAVRLVAQEAALTGDRRDAERLEKLLVDVEKLGAGVDFVRFLHATICERKGQFKEAAEHYRGVGEANGYFGQSMISAAHCWRRDAAKRTREEAVRDLGLAEETLRRFLAWTEGRGKMDSGLVGVAWRELAAVYIALGRPKEALDCLDRVPQDQDPDGRMRAWELQVQVQLSEKKLDDAATTLDRMLKEKPEAPATVRSCRMVFRALDQAISRKVIDKAEPREIRELSKKAVTYAARWVGLAGVQGAPSTSDLMEAADSLYQGARRLNDLGDGVASFIDLQGRKIPDRKPWEQAADAHRMLLAGKREDLTPKDRLVAQTRLARCLSFHATDAKEWEGAKAQYDSIVQEHKMVDRRGLLDFAVLQAQPILLSVYIELGEVYFELGKRGQVFQYDNAASVFTNTIRVMAPGGEAWWWAKYKIIAMLFERGKETDVRDARVLIENLERNNPEFDGGKFGMKERFIELKEKILKVSGK